MVAQREEGRMPEGVGSEADVGPLKLFGRIGSKAELSPRLSAIAKEGNV